MHRDQTRRVAIGPINVGGGAPVVIQSMTSTYTYDVDATVAQIQRLATAGCDVVRVATPTRKDTAALPEILRQVSLPVVADVHYHFERALEAVEAGVHKIRLNPGNIADRDQVARVIAACKERGIPIRVGVNEGSVVERTDKNLRAAQKAALATNPSGDPVPSGESSLQPLVRLMADVVADYLRMFEENDFHDVVISAKSIDATVVIAAYREIARRFNLPLHLGLTHAGPPETGRIRSIAALGTLLAEGIGDTIRISYAADPVLEVEDAKELLYSLNLRRRRDPELIACPTCGRIEIDLVDLVGKVRTKLGEINSPVKVAIMGCVVNGPGECEGADVAIFAGKGKGIIYVQGEQRQTVPEDQMLDALLEECRDLERRVQAGQAKLGSSNVTIAPPDPLPRADGSVPLPMLRT
jgi:(E)-4-hydroxy-3-methylbut-2-enyl-diphosphate synthase